MQGKFIVFEGLDRCGKSTMVRLLHESSPETTAVYSFPNRSTPIGKMIDSFLSSKAEFNAEAIHLLYSANRWECVNEIKTLLSEGKTVICDRYWFSGVAYSFAKGLDFQWCVAPDKGLLEPDTIVFLKAEPETLAKRAGYGQERYQKVQFQKKVSQAFERLMTHEAIKPKVQVVQVADKGIQQVLAQLKALLSIQ